MDEVFGTRSVQPRNEALGDDMIAVPDATGEQITAHGALFQL
jgi:hypothetical protein